MLHGLLWPRRDKASSRPLQRSWRPHWALEGGRPGLLIIILMIGFGANFMGTALIIGDLPPQMLHSVAGAEFFDFIWHKGRPSSFPMLMTTFLITLGAMWYYGFRGHKRVTNMGSLEVEAKIPNPLFATAVVVWFLATVVAMSMREHIGV
jgi:Na+/H+ antiporter NhaD/arsenite permease-like protein